jgi:hypothetical protein
VAAGQVADALVKIPLTQCELKRICVPYLKIYGLELKLVPGLHHLPAINAPS